MIKRNIPNLLTLGNLLCGCLGLVEVLQNGFILGACFLMAVALLLDFFDGFVARLLKVNSPLGVQLDSLADMVTFGVLPAAIFCYILKNHANIPEPYDSFGFIIALFSCLRLAKFNIDTRQSDSFIGVPTPANAIFIAALALNLENGANDLLTQSFKLPWLAITFAVLSSYLLIAELPLFALKFKNFTWADNKMKFIFLIVSALAIVLFKTIALPWIILGYVGLSVLMRKI